jgi:signal transduction histidine kinase
MAKETAHQLGTPLSSLIAWTEFLKTKGIDDNTLSDIKKDIHRLETITDRFSKIGSPPKLQKENIVKVIYNSIEYIKSRTSKNITYTINLPETEDLPVPLNVQLFEWAIENLCKNAIDAMSGTGNIDIHISDEITMVYIDVTDTGKGIPKSKYKTIFNPGYTSKQRGWGLGLTLAERIIEIYHTGHLFVKQSALNKGTTFRIVLNK